MTHIPAGMPVSQLNICWYQLEVFKVWAGFLLPPSIKLCVSAQQHCIQAHKWQRCMIVLFPHGMILKLEHAHVVTNSL